MKTGYSPIGFYVIFTIQSIFSFISKKNRWNYDWNQFFENYERILFIGLMHHLNSRQTVLMSLKVPEHEKIIKHLKGFGCKKPFCPPRQWSGNMIITLWNHTNLKPSNSIIHKNGVEWNGGSVLVKDMQSPSKVNIFVS